MCCQGIDSFKTLLVYLFSAYLVDRHQAIFYDPQDDIFITDRSILLSKAHECVHELQEADLQNELLTQPRGDEQNFILWEQGFYPVPI